jgi:hypothetical protein
MINRILKRVLKPHTDSARFVNLLYRLLFHRTPEPASLRHWTKTLARTGDPAWLISQFMASPEFHRMEPKGVIPDANAAARLPYDVDIIVPVCNAAGWIDMIADGYDELGLDPLFIVDTNSTDESLQRLTARKARVMVATGQAPRVESLLYSVVPKLRSPWILRFDDDELPSAALIGWVAANLRSLAAPAVGFPRQWVCAADTPTRWAVSHCANASAAAGGDACEDRQYRLFLRRDVVLDDLLHTAGFHVEGVAEAPSAAVIYHFDWLVRSYAARRRKVANYDQQSLGQGRRYAAYYLPEERDPSFYDFLPLTDPAAIRIAARLLEAGSTSFCEQKEAKKLC